MKGKLGKIWEFLSGTGDEWFVMAAIEGFKNLLKTKEGGEMALKVIRDITSRGEAGSEALSILLSKLQENEESSALSEKLLEWLRDNRDGVIRLQKALDYHFKDLKDGVVAQVRVILFDDKEKKTGEKVDWPDGLRPEDVLFKTWKAILSHQSDKLDAISLAVTYFTTGRESKAARAWEATRKWFSMHDVGRRTAELVRRYIYLLLGLTTGAVLFVGSALHFALEERHGWSLLFFGVAALLIAILYAVRLPLQESWELVSRVFNLDERGEKAWQEQKKLITKRIGYAAAALMILFLIPFGSHPTHLMFAIIGTVVAFTLREDKRWQQLGIGVAIIASLLALMPRAEAVTREHIVPVASSAVELAGEVSSKFKWSDEKQSVESWVEGSNEQPISPTVYSCGGTLQKRHEIDLTNDHPTETVNVLSPWNAKYKPCIRTYTKDGSVHYTVNGVPIGVETPKTLLKMPRGIRLREIRFDKVEIVNTAKVVVEIWGSPLSS